MVLHSLLADEELPADFPVAEAPCATSRTTSFSRSLRSVSSRLWPVSADFLKASTISAVMRLARKQRAPTVFVPRGMRPACRVLRRASPSRDRHCGAPLRDALRRDSQPPVERLRLRLWLHNHPRFEERRAAAR